MSLPAALRFVSIPGLNIRPEFMYANTTDALKRGQSRKFVMLPGSIKKLLAKASQPSTTLAVPGREWVRYDFETV
jgi:hypothetical protein